MMTDEGLREQRRGEEVRGADRGSRVVKRACRGGWVEILRA